MLRKSLVSSFLAFGLMFAPTIAAAGEGAECHQEKLSLQAVVDKHLKAVGGKERLKAVKSFQVTTSSREGDIVTTSTMQRARPNLVRYDMDKNGTWVSKMFDGQQGWTVEGSAAPQRLDKEKNAMMAEGAALREGHPERPLRRAHRGLRLQAGDAAELSNTSPHPGAPVGG